MIEAFCKANRLKEAFEVLSLMRDTGIAPLPETTHPIFTHLKLDLDKLDDTWGILDAMKNEGKSVDIAAINVIVQASIFLGDIQRAIGSYKAAVDYGAKADADTFNLLLSACISFKHRSLGDYLLNEMKELGIKPNSRTFERMIVLCLTQTTYEDAFFYLEEMKSHKFLPPLGVYDTIIRKCVSVGDTRYKLALDEMKQCGYEGTESLYLFIKHGGVYVPPTIEIGAPNPMEEVKQVEEKQPEKQGEEEQPSS